MRLYLVVSLDNPVSKIVTMLQERRLVSELQRVRQYLVFPTHSLAPLNPGDRLSDVGLADLSTVFLRTSVPGGSPDSSTDSTCQFSFARIGATDCNVKL